MPQPSSALSTARGVAPSRPGVGVELLTVATLTPRKGYDVLVEALATLTHLPWHLTCAGGTGFHPPTAEAIRGRIFPTQAEPSWIGEIS